jgi:hypothetical protein
LQERSCSSVSRAEIALAATRSNSLPVDFGRGYFPRAVFFFGFGLLVLPDLPGAGSFFGRFGDTVWGAKISVLPANQRFLGREPSFGTPHGCARPPDRMGDAHPSVARPGSA